MGFLWLYQGNARPMVYLGSAFSCPFCKHSCKLAGAVGQTTVPENRSACRYTEMKSWNQSKDQLSFFSSTDLFFRFTLNPCVTRCWTDQNASVQGPIRIDVNMLAVEGWGRIVSCTVCMHHFDALVQRISIAWMPCGYTESCVDANFGGKSGCLNELHLSPISYLCMGF